VNEDIDPRDADSVIWALSFRMQPHRDTRIVTGRLSSLDPSVSPLRDFSRADGKRGTASSLLIDATVKWDYPPVSLPKKEFMENARAIWNELGLPELQPKTPFFGYSLGYWSRENEEEAELALNGEHYKTGAKIEQEKIIKK